MSGTENITAPIEAFAIPLLTDMGLELVELQYRREGRGWVLRFFIDKEGGVTIDDCTQASRAISAYLEVEDLIDSAYTLEVSSPGLERPLKRREDFARFSSRLAKVKLRDPLDGQYVFVGHLEGLDEDKVLLRYEEQVLVFAFENIVKARLVLE